MIFHRVTNLIAISYLCAVIMALMASSAHAQERTIRIDSFDVVLVVDSRGILDVTERLRIAFEGEWDGIVRDLSLQHFNAEGRPGKLKIKLRDITDRAGNPLRFDSESEDRLTRSIRIWMPGARDTVRHVVIRYTVSNAIRFFYAESEAGELDELYWNVTGDSWELPIANARARVGLLMDARPLRTAVYTGPTGSTSSDAKITVADGSVTFTTRRELGPYEGMTIAVGWPAGFIASRPSARMRRATEAARYWPAILPFGLFAFAFVSWRRRGRDPKPDAISVRYEPIAGISPAEMGTLINNRADMRDITATLVDLAVRGYLCIVDEPERGFLGIRPTRSFKFVLVRPRSAWHQLKPHESCYLDALFGSGDTVKLAQLENRFSESLPTLRDALYDSLVHCGYYEHRPDRVSSRWRWFALGVLIAGLAGASVSVESDWLRASAGTLATASTVSAIIVALFSLVVPARTVSGARAREAALGFREFLSRVESDRYRRMITSPEMFERYLPYAIAFGVEEKWGRAFDGIYRRPPHWYRSNHGQAFSASRFTARLNRLSQVTSGTMAKKSRVSGSGGGGYSGGGSGGGGGRGF